MAASGSRGPLKLPKKHLQAVPDSAEETPSVGDKIEPKMPPKPEHLQVGELSTLWDMLVPRMAEYGMVTEVDGLAIELCLRHYVAARAASEQLADADSVAIVDEGHDGRMQKHPADAVFRAQSAMFLQFARELGLTFVARARTPAAKGPDGGEKNPFASPVGSA